MPSRTWRSRRVPCSGRSRPMSRRSPGPRSSLPHLNGKVERVQRTALDEFWSSADLADPAVIDRFVEWQRFYNAARPHSSLGGRTPAERLRQLQHMVPSLETIQASYDPKREWDRPHDYRWDLGPYRPG